MSSRDPFQTSSKSFDSLARAAGRHNPALQGTPEGPVNQNFAHSLPLAEIKKPVDRRKRRPTRPLRLLPGVQAQIKKLAAQLEVPEWMVLRFLLETSLTHWRVGKLELTPKLRPAGLTLYPEEKRASNRKRNLQTRVVSHRNLPESLHSTMKAVAELLGVPLWQVCNRLLEHGLEEHRLGQLDFPLRPVISTEKTLYP